MSRFTTTLGLVLVVSSCLATSIIAQGDAKGDKEKLQGTWVGTVKEGGKTHEVRMEFKADKFTGSVNGLAAMTRTYKINSEKSPATMDIRLKWATAPAIYELIGDELKICHPFKEGGSRPSAFEATEKTVLATSTVPVDVTA